MAKKKIVGFSEGSMDPRMMIDIMGSRSMRREQYGSPAVKDMVQVKTSGVKSRIENPFDKLSEEERALYDAVVEGADRSQWAVRAGLTESQVDKTIDKLVKEGFLVRIEREEVQETILPHNIRDVSEWQKPLTPGTPGTVTLFPPDRNKIWNPDYPYYGTITVPDDGTTSFPPGYIIVERTPKSEDSYGGSSTPISVPPRAPIFKPIF